MAAHGQTQQAQNVTVTRNVRRYGSYPGGYQIINTSLYSTVWASDNPSMQSGQGTPISPGTSINWTGDGDIFLIVGDDATSLNPLLGASVAAVVLTYDVQNWQPNPVAVAAAVLNSGVIIVDAPVELVSGVLPATSQAYDVSRYNCLICHIFPFAAGGPYAVEIQWSNTASFAGILARDRLYWVDSVGVTDWDGTIPCRAAFFRVVVTGALNMTARIVASYRQVPQLRQTLGPGVQVLLHDTTLAVPPGASAGLYIPPWYGEVEISCYYNGIAADNSYMSIDGYAGLTTGFDATAIALNNTGGSFVIGGFIWNKIRLALTGAQTRMRYVNSSAANKTFSVTVSPVLTELH